MYDIYDVARTAVQLSELSSLRTHIHALFKTQYYSRSQLCIVHVPQWSGDMHLSILHV